MASVPSEELEYQNAHAHEDESRSLTIFFIVCLIVVFVSIVSRIWSRLWTRVKIGWDDITFLVGAVIVGGSVVVLLIYSTRAGLGRHWLTLSPEEQTLFSKLNYAFNILNVSCYPIIKISVMLLYLRIFTSRNFHLATWACIVFVALMGVANTVVAVFACTPIQGFYNRAVAIRCIDEVAWYWSTAVLNIVTDAMVLILPMPVLWSVQMSLSRKIAISTLFMLGGLTFILAILRIVYYLQINPYDPSYSFLGTAYSTPAETTLATLCACAPTWRSLTRKLVEVTRSHFSSLGNSRTYVNTDSKQRSHHDKASMFDDSKYAQRDRDSSLELVTSSSAPSHGRADKEAYVTSDRGFSGILTDDYLGHRIHGGETNGRGAPAQGIQIQREFKVE